MSTQHQSEAIVLRTWPFAEADLIVSLFTREQGVVRGVARHAMRSRRRFGGALEPLSEVRATWAERPRQDVARLDSLEILWSPLRDEVDPLRAAGLAVLAEVLAAALPERAPEDDVYRLAAACMKSMRPGAVLLPVTYFLVWITRLLGWLPDLQRCAGSGEPLRGEAACFSPDCDGLFLGRCRPPRSIGISGESLAFAGRILRKPLPAIAAENWPLCGAVDLRRFTAATLERHLDERLISLRMLAKMAAG